MEEMNICFELIRNNTDMLLDQEEAISDRIYETMLASVYNLAEDPEDEDHLKARFDAYHIKQKEIIRTMCIIELMRESLDTLEDELIEEENSTMLIITDLYGKLQRKKNKGRGCA